ncbi:hypothetical protein PCK2_000876 [Pneumocystis canis]|nr:hypothetical protein PCK2_000876 [Pneumocystis canis]
MLRNAQRLSRHLNKMHSFFKKETYATVSQGVGRPMALHGIDGTYATALYYAAVKHNLLEKTQQSLQSLCHMIQKDSKLSMILENSSLTSKDRLIIAEVFAKSLDNHPFMLNFLKLLAEKNRLKLMENISKKFSSLINMEKGETEVIITSAYPLDAQSLNRLESSIAKSKHIGSGKKLKIITKINPSIMGGLIVEIGNYTIDLSVANRILKLNQALTGGKISVNVEIFPDPFHDNDDNDAMSAFLSQSLLQSLSGIRLERLLVTSTKAWSIFIDAVVISSNSHALPALALAVRLALQTTKLPRIVIYPTCESIDANKVIPDINSEDFEVDYDLKNAVPVPDIEKVGVVIFVAHVGDNILYDLSSDEMAVVEGLLVVGVLENGQISYTRRIHPSSIYKISNHGLKRSMIKSMLEGAVKIGQELIKKSEEDIICHAKDGKMNVFCPF